MAAGGGQNGAGGRRARVNPRALRAGELLSLVGAGCVVASLLAPWYAGSAGTFDAWDTFGPGIVLLLAATCAALALVVGTLAERTVAVPVALGVWGVLLGLLAVIAAVVRLLSTPAHAGSLRAGAWLALAGAVAILAGAWLALSDERTSRYSPARPPPRPRP